MSTANQVPPSSTTSKSKIWFPLESNPPLVNKYIQNLGFDTTHYEFTDVYSTESWALEMIPQPVAAVLMLYPISEKQENYRKTEKVESTNESSNVWFMKQRIGNACGTIGIMHALANIPNTLKQSSIQKSSWIDSYLQKCPISTTDPIHKAEIFENDDKIETMHDAATSDESNQTNRGDDINQKVDTHFVALVHVNGKLYELDGRKDGPVCHGETTQALIETKINTFNLLMRGKSPIFSGKVP